MKKLILIIFVCCLINPAFCVFGKAEQSADTEITAEFSCSADNAEIGQPFEIQYKLSGGSGEFNQVTLQALFPLGSGTSYGGFSERTNAKEGSCTIIPEEGKKISVQLHGYDSIGKYFYIDMGDEIPILPNPDLPVAIEFGKISVSTDEEIIVSYNIHGCSAFSGSASWTIGEKGEYWDKYSQELNEQNITGTSGMLSFTPSYGDYAYLVLRGCDENGNPVYIESDLITIVDSQSYEEISAQFSCSADNAEIGQPFEIQYKLSGGSGEFDQVTLQALFPLGSGTSYGGFSERTNTKEGSCRIIPEEGKKISVQLYGYDSIGKYFYIDMGDEIPILPNPDLPVAIEFGKTSVSKDEEIIVSYNIHGCSAFSGSASWTIGERGEYWDKYSQELNEQNITGTSGMLSFTPAFGDYVYLVLRGTDEKGRPVYVESDAVNIINSWPSNETIVLPAGLTSIGSNAFKGISAKAIVIPASIQYIADDAFADSCVVTLYGNSDYVQEYASAHGFEFAMAY